MNTRVKEILKNHINDFKSYVEYSYPSNRAIFDIFNSYFQKHRDKGLKMDDGVKVRTIIKNGMPMISFYLSDDSYERNGISFILEFDNEEYIINFRAWVEVGEHHFRIDIFTTEQVNYSGTFIHYYLLYNALEASNLKGSYFTMPRDSFHWDVKGLENRTFDDIYLPKDITEDLKLYTDIYDKTGKILRYLMVGNPGTAKTESGLVLSNVLNKKGVTIIKTPICKQIHRKVELASVLAPSIIIFDDIDLSLGSRNSGGYSQLLGDFLDVLDGTDKLANNVGIIATTNAAHLLDLAAQRPGRFDKTLLFDNITKDNIKNIIIKSLSYNFGECGFENKSVQLYTANEIVNRFYDAGVSGSHIFNAIKMLKLRYDTLNMSDKIKTQDIIDAIEQEIKVIDKIRKTSYLNEKYDRSNSKIGFGSNIDEYEEMPRPIKNVEITRKINYND